MYLTHEQVRELKRLSSRTGVPQSVMIRRGVDFAIKETSMDLALGKKGGK